MLRVQTTVQPGGSQGRDEEVGRMTMETPGENGSQSSMRLKGYVVRIDAGTEKGHSAVGVVFTD